MISLLLSFSQQTELKNGTSAALRREIGRGRTFAVLYTAPWCKACAQAAEVLEQVHEHTGQVVKIFSVDCSLRDNQSCVENKVSKFPTLLLFAHNNLKVSKPLRFVDDYEYQEVLDFILEFYRNPFNVAHSAAAILKFIDDYRRDPQPSVLYFDPETRSNLTVHRLGFETFAFGRKNVILQGTVDEQLQALPFYKKLAKNAFNVVIMNGGEFYAYEGEFDAAKILHWGRNMMKEFKTMETRTQDKSKAAKSDI